LRALARDAGVDLDRETDANHWLIPFTWPGYPSLSLHALEFEFPHEPAPGVHYVGPMLLEDRLEPPLPQDDRSRLDQLLERHGRSEPGSALLYAGFGSFFTARQGWLERLFAAVARRPGWDLVLSLGGRLQASDLGELPRGVHAFAWAPQLEVLARADAAIVHGGISTVDECVLAGVPMLVVCGGHTDMRGNMARVVHHGIGLAADPARDTPDRILQSLDRLVSEDSFADRLDQMGRAYRRYGTQRVAERVVEELLVDHPGVDLSGSGRS
jgi:MGT family glycosyltransferase